MQCAEMLGDGTRVTPNWRASTVVVAGERSTSSSRARTAPSSSAGALPSAAGEKACHTVATPRAGYTSVVCVLVERRTDTSGQLNTLGMITRPSGASGTVTVSSSPPVSDSTSASPVQRRSVLMSLNRARAPPSASTPVR